jgi:hypothetical protein
MPNHVHAVVTPTDGWELSAILHSWKSFTAHQANEILKRQGTFWERESFDHLIRTFDHFEAFVRYVESNPVEARLCQAPEDWPWSSARLRKNAAETAAPQPTGMILVVQASGLLLWAAGTAAPQEM